MPILGADMQTGTLIAWRKQPGDAVRHGDIIAEVETEKGLIEVEVFATGVIERLLVEPGATVPVGTAVKVTDPNGGSYYVDCEGQVVVGDYIGAQMAGFDAAAPLGLIDNLQDAEPGKPYPAYTCWARWRCSRPICLQTPWPPTRR